MMRSPRPSAACAKAANSGSIAWPRAKASASSALASMHAHSISVSWRLPISSAFQRRKASVALAVPRVAKRRKSAAPMSEGATVPSKSQR